MVSSIDSIGFINRFNWFHQSIQLVSSIDSIGFIGFIGFPTKVVLQLGPLHSSFSFRLFSDVPVTYQEKPSLKVCNTLHSADLVAIR